MLSLFFFRCIPFPFLFRYCCFAATTTGAEYCMMHLLVGGFRPRYTSVEHENLDNSVFEDAAAPRAMFDEDQEQNEPPPMHRSKSSLGAQSRGILHCTI